MAVPLLNVARESDVMNPDMTLRMRCTNYYVGSILVSKKNAPRPYKHSPVRGENIQNVYVDQRLQIIQNLLWHFNVIPDANNTGLS